VRLPVDTSDLLEAAVASVDALDAEALDAIFTRAGIRLSRPAILERLVLPLMKYVGDGWREGRLRVAHEHLATTCTRSFLGNIERTYPSEPSAPAIVVATPAGQVHELGALAAAATAASEGYRVTYLGASLPAEDILAACELRGCHAIALSITYPADDPTLAAELRRLGKSLEGGIRVLVGGQSARAYGATLEEIGAIVVDDLGAMRRMLAYGATLEEIGAIVVDDLGAMRRMLERLRVAPGEVGL
jgi:methanogenic corrinoid protein MtbC1